MSSIFFMAVQCCQCSTMQVKQRKKYSKSNKWVCVVCNQKQSICKVFAQAPMAKDLRVFVQSFNMSRQSQPQISSREFPPPPDSSGDSKRPRSDWTEFLNPDDAISPTHEPGGDSGPEIVTEMPVGLFRKAKLNKYSETGDDSGELDKPIFSKRNASTKHLLIQEKKPLEPMSHDFAKATRCGSKENHEKREIGKGREASKWSNYMTLEDDENSVRLIGGGGRFAGHRDDRSTDMLESFIDEEKVEDEEIHPGFL